MDTIATTKKRMETGTAAELRLILGACFPHTLFQVSSRREANDDLLEIAYTDGACSKRVWNAVRHLQKRAQPDIHISGVRIEITRRMSARVRSLLLEETASVFNLKQLPRETDRFAPIGGTLREYTEMIFRMRDFE